MNITVRRSTLIAVGSALLGALIMTSVQAGRSEAFSAGGLDALGHACRPSPCEAERLVQGSRCGRQNLRRQGSSLLMQQVAARDVDVGWAQIGTMMVAACKALPVKAVSVLARAGDLGFMADRSKYKTLADLRGRSWLIPRPAARVRSWKPSSRPPGCPRRTSRWSTSTRRHW